MNSTVRENLTQVARTLRTTDQASQGRDQGHRELHILQGSTLAAATGSDITRDKWLWHRHGLDILRMLHGRGPACLPKIEFLGHVRITNGQHGERVIRTRTQRSTAWSFGTCQ